MSCEHKCLKGNLYLLNVLLFVSGFTMLVVSSLVVSETNVFKEFIQYMPKLIVPYQGKIFPVNLFY